jgi:hypothetical protein
LYATFSDLKGSAESAGQPRVEAAKRLKPWIGNGEGKSPARVVNFTYISLKAHRMLSIAYFGKPAYSGASWPSIPIEVGRQFRSHVGHSFRRYRKIANFPPEWVANFAGIRSKPLKLLE